MSRRPGPLDSTLTAPFTLTRAEQTVLQLVLLGKSSQQIADELFVAKRTVDFHIAHIYQKMEVRNRMEMVIIAMKHDMHPLFTVNGPQEGTEFEQPAPCPQMAA